MAGRPDDIDRGPDGDGREPRGARPVGVAPRVGIPERRAIELDAVGAALIVCAPDGTVVALNHPAADLLGVDETEAIGSSLLDVRAWAGVWTTEAGHEIPPGGSLIATSGFAGQTVSDQVVALRREKDGAALWLRISAEPIRSLTGEVEDVVLTLVDITGLKASAEALRDALRELADRDRTMENLLANVPGLAYRCANDPAWPMQVLSDGCAQVTGYTPDELLGPHGTTFADVMHVDDREPVWAEIQAALGRREPWTITYRLVTKSGETRWMWERGVGVRADDGELLYLEGFISDITGLHTALEAKAESERRLRTIIDNVPGMVYRSQATAPWSDEFIAGGDVSVTGYSVDELTHPGFRWVDVMHADDVHLLESASQAALQTGRGAAEYRIHAKDGGERWLLDLFSLLQDEQGRPLAQEGILLDVTDRHRVQDELREAERALRESEQRYRSLYDGTPAGVFVCDGDGMVVDGNVAFEEMLGEPVSSLAGSSVADLVAGTGFLAPLEQALKGRDGSFEGRFVTAAGRNLWLSLTAAPRFNADGEVAGATAVMVDRTRQKDSEEQVRHLLLHDPVTGLANRSLLEDRVGQALKHARRRRLAFALAAFRVDRFDTLESSLGSDHVGGLLEQLGRRLQHAGRAEDTVAHLGGGHFAALLPGAAGPPEAGAAVSGLLAAVAEPLEVGEHELFLTLSLGVAIYPTDGSTTAELFHNAETAVRQASDGGGDRWRFFHAGLNEERADRLKLDAELHRALEGDQFFLEYQPVVDAATEAVIGVEALVRWRHPDRGVVMPLDFIPVAEDTGILTPIGAWVLREACRQGREWRRGLGRPLRMAVNISARQLHDETLVETVRETLRSTGFDPRSLELEITETAAMRDARHTAQILGALRAMGVRVALDDFGTGYSSLSHLVRLPISTVKIDRSFVRDLLAVPEHAAVAASVIALGHRLGLTVVAEGVETVAERKALRDEGCDAIQGFLYSRPLPADECGALLDKGVIRR